MTDPKDFIYELPDGYEFKPEHREKIDAILAKLGVTDNALAQELINVHVEIVENYAAELNAAQTKEKGE